jgi:DNA-binding beta-propeller fold protein YncE
MCVSVMCSGSTLYVADDADMRILTVDTTDGTLAFVSGSGAQGTQDGDAASTQWDSPWGMALTPDGTRLYVTERTAPAVRSVAVVPPPSDVEWAVTSQVRSPHPSACG